MIFLANRRFLAIVAILLTTAAAFADPPPRSASHQVLSAPDNARFQRALHLYDSQELPAAEALLAPLASAYHANSSVQAAEGTVLLEMGRLREGIPFLERSLQLGGRDPALAQNLAIAYVKTGDPSRAIPLLRPLCTPKGRTGCLQLAEAELATRDFAAAATSFQEAASSAVSSTPSELRDLHHDWAETLLGAGQPAKAASLLRETPGYGNDESLQLLLAEAEERDGHFQQAFQAFKTAAQLNPTESNIFAYGQELLRHWNFSEAASILQFGTQKFPESDRMHLALGVAYFGKNDFARAAQIFQPHLTHNPTDAEAADLLGRSCSALGGGDAQACAGLPAFAAAHPQNATAAFYAAVTLLQQPGSAETAQKAEALLRQCLAVDPRRPEAWYQLAVLQQSRNDWQGSQSALLQAVALRPEYAEAHYRLSRAYSHLGRQADAREEIALQQRYALTAKEAERQRMQEVVTFVTSSN